MLATLDQLPPPLVERIHFEIEPVWPLNVIVPVFVPEQTFVAPVVVPPATGVTVIVTLVELAELHTPLCTTARNNVIWARLV